jgi:hypothetical protein
LTSPSRSRLESRGNEWIDQWLISTAVLEGVKINNGGALMKKSLFISILVVLIGGFFALSVAAEIDTLVSFKGGIGVIPVSRGVGTADTAEIVNRNIVRGVQPAGQIWVIDDLDARVRTNGDIRIKGKGLILGGGNNAGRAGDQSVFATLICEAARPMAISKSRTCWRLGHRLTARAPCSSFATQPTWAGSLPVFPSSVDPISDSSWQPNEIGT